MGNTPGYMKGTSSTMKKGSKKDVVKPASAISANKKTGKFLLPLHALILTRGGWGGGGGGAMA